MHQDAGGKRKLMKRPLISAHRGECGVEGLPAAERYRRAIELGADFVELDVHRTADGVYVVAHDDLTPSRRAINATTYEDFRGELGVEALRLDELLDIAEGRAGIHIDLKELGYEGELVHLVRGRFPDGRLVFTGSDASIKALKGQFPDARAGLSLGDDLEGAPLWRRIRVRWSELFPARRLRLCGADFLAVHQQLARLTVLRFCARAGIPAWVWTVDDKPEIARFLADPRVTTLITNRPDLALSLRASA
jgi:glycerophosphoryl diester phosphodiesterase